MKNLCIAVLLGLIFTGCTSINLGSESPIFNEPVGNNKNKEDVTDPKAPTQEEASSPKPKPLPPAARTMLSRADQERNAQNYERAEYYVERALRISPRSAKIHFYYAQLLLAQEKHKLAESRAFKALTLTKNDSRLKRRAWLLIAISRQNQGNFKGSREARSRASRYSH